MKRLKTTLAAALFAGSAFTAAQGAVLENGIIEGNRNFATVDHWYFSVNTAGDVQIDVTRDISNDFEMSLRFDDGTGNLGTFIENDDDDGPGFDPRINSNLAAGDYVLLVGLYALPNEITDFRNPDSEPETSPYILSISGDTTWSFVREGNLDGSYTLRENPTPVPLPAGMPLLLVGLGAMAALRTKRNKRN